MSQVFYSIWVGVILQVVYMVLFFGSILPKMNNIVGALTCLAIGALSLIVGIFSRRSKQNSLLPIVVIGIAILILAFTVFAYFLGEAGYPPLITQ